MQIIENKALLFKTRNPDKYSVIPRSKIVEEYEDGSASIAVFWGLDEARVLNLLVAPGQRQGRALLWDKTIDRQTSAEFAAARVAQKPYVYHPQA
jgi:hypothetical protein